MNLLLLVADDISPDGTARVTDRRLSHANSVWKVEPGDSLRVGMLGGAVGSARVLAISGAELVLDITLGEPPPARPGLDVVLAMPRPRVLKRILSTVAQLGVDRLVLVNAARVERSYFSSPVLTNDSVRDALIEGLEQARDTRLPEVLLRERFRPFVEDELDQMFPLESGVRLLAHPTSARMGAQGPAPRIVVAIGPEGGWVPFEIEQLEARGFVGFSLGERVLRTETLLPYLLGALRRTFSS